MHNICLHTPHTNHIYFSIDNFSVFVDVNVILCMEIKCDCVNRYDSSMNATYTDIMAVTGSHLIICILPYLALLSLIWDLSWATIPIDIWLDCSIIFLAKQTLWCSYRYQECHGYCILMHVMVVVIGKLKFVICICTAVICFSITCNSLENMFHSKTAK